MSGNGGPFEPIDPNRPARAVERQKRLWARMTPTQRQEALQAEARRIERLEQKGQSDAK